MVTRRACQLSGECSVFRGGWHFAGLKSVLIFADVAVVEMTAVCDTGSHFRSYNWNAKPPKERKTSPSNRGSLLLTLSYSYVLGTLLECCLPP